MLEKQAKQIVLQAEAVLDDPNTKKLEMSLDFFAPWSLSKYKTLDKCPLQFLLNYVLKIKVDTTPEVTQENVVTHLGITCHEILEYMYSGMSEEESYEKAKANNYENVTHKFWSRIDDLMVSIRAFNRRMDKFKEIHDIMEIIPEQKLAVNRKLEPVDFFDPNAFFRGVIDLCLHMRNHDVILIDHKHGGEPSWGLRNFNLQLDTYKMLYHYAKAPVKSAAGGIHFIAASDIILGPPTSVEHIETKVFKQLLFLMDCAVGNVIELKKFKQTRSSKCTYCDFADLCKGGKRGTAYLLEPIIDMSKELL